MNHHYAPLWCQSNYSFLEGASHPDELVEQAHHLGLRSLAITDRDGIYGIVRAFTRARTLGLHIITGATVTVHSNASSASDNTNHSDLILLAQTHVGYRNLCKLLTLGRLRCQKGTSAVYWNEVCEYADGLVALWGIKAPDNHNRQIATRLKEAFCDRLSLRLSRHSHADDIEIERATRELAVEITIPLAACYRVLYHHVGRRPLQDILTCIRHKTSLTRAKRLLRPNAEHDLKSSHSFQRLYADTPSAITRTLDIAASCEFSLANLRYRYPSERLPDGKTSSQWLHTLTFEGARKRYAGGVPPKLVEQLNRELTLIDELDYCGYFLTMYEIVEFCHRENILCQGRGSAANSSVCFCLGITAVDPTKIGLLFERFLSRERAEPPDIDLDIEHNRREEVIQHVYAKYGRDHAAMVANFIRYRPKSAVREVGKALGIPETALDRATKMLGRYNDVAAQPLIEAGFDLKNPAHQQLFALANEILDFPRHLSIHPGGFLLGHEAVHSIVPIENATMPGRTVIQWDKDDIEELGLFKVDLLGLGALHQLHICFDLIKKYRGVDLSLANIPDDDKATYDMICRSDTVGVFQIESRAQMSMLPRLRPRYFYDLVVEISIVRPGPITGGMVHPYLRRRDGVEDVIYPHPCLEPVLKKTLGIPLFQEQVMQLAVVAADYTAGEADQLRRDMAAWRRSGRIDAHRERLISRMTAKGITQEFAIRVFDQIRGFGEYGFPESHAASFALIAYATSWLRCHYMPEFTCSLLNAQPMGFYSPSTIVNDARRHGVDILPVDITQSEWDCTLEWYRESWAIRMGLRYIKSLRQQKIQQITTMRDTSPFTSLQDFVQRSSLPKNQLDRLAEAGALAALPSPGQSHCHSRRSALWQVKGFLRTRDDALPFADTDASMQPSFHQLGPLESLLWDYRASSHSTHGHLLQPLRDRLRKLGLPDARNINTMPNRRHIRYAGIVICRQRPGTASGVTFMTLEDETGFVNTVIWKRVFERYSVLAKSSAFLGITGKLQVEQGITHLIAEKLWIPPIDIDQHNQRSRDFR